MSPLDYLRAMARKQKPATGGIVRYDPDRAPVVLSSCWHPVRPAAAPYEGVTVQMRGYTEMTDEERRQFLDSLNAAMGRPKSGPATRDGLPQPGLPREGRGNIAPKGGETS